MKVVFIEKKLRTDKLGILYLSSILKNAGHDVDLIQADLIDVDSYIDTNKPDFIMYSVMSGEHQWFSYINHKLRSNHRFISVVGGPHFTFFPEQGMKDDYVDFVVQGPGEGVILDIVEGRIKDKFVLGHIPNVEELPEPDRSILYKFDEFGKSRMKRFISGRYCLYSCKYCFNHIFKKIYKDEKDRFYQRVSPSKMIAEIKNVKDTYGLELAYFNDDDLASDKKWLLAFCTKFKSEVGIEFCGSIRANSVDYDTLKLMKDSGCVFLNIALESANPETQKFLRRGFITNDLVIAACKYCKDLGIKVRLQNMIGLPVADPLQDALDTLKMNQEIHPTDSWAAIFQPYTKTDLWQYCIDIGLIDENTQAGNFYEHTKLKIKDADKIDRLHKWWFFAVRYRFPIALVKLLINLPITEEQATVINKLKWDISKRLLYGL